MKIIARLLPIHAMTALPVEAHHAPGGASYFQFAASVLDRPRSRLNNQLDTPQAAGAGCDVQFVKRNGSSHASCVLHTRDGSLRRQPLNASCCRALQLFAASRISARFAELFGRTKQLSTLPLSQSAAFGQPPTKSQASKSHRFGRLKRFSTLCLSVSALSFFALATPAQAARHHNYKHHHRHVVPDANGNRAQIIGGRPAGCPYQFCACGIRLFFGMRDRSLDLAANWRRKFNRSEPGHLKVAARDGHAFLLLSHIRGKVWLVKDWNSGHHLTRIHARSIAGFTIVDPQSPRLANL